MAEVLCKTKWERVGYSNEISFSFRRIYSHEEIDKERGYSYSGARSSLIACEPYNHKGNCETCKYRNYKGEVNLFEEDKDW